MNDVVRIFVTESNGLRPRYQDNDILTEKARKFLPFSNVDQNENECILSLSTKYDVIIKYDPFKMIILKDGKEEMIVNEFDNFYFEAYIERKDYSQCEGEDCPSESEEERALWEEKFSSHTYHYDYGAASVGLDFTFVDTRFVYGIPEHASSLPLKNTVNDENGYNEPYRLWNLDVFEYKLDVTDSLYADIPFALGYNANTENSVFWMNTAETYVDVMDSPSKRGKNVRWMSESGVIEAFIILSSASSASSYLSQYYELTGTSSSVLASLT